MSKKTFLLRAMRRGIFVCRKGLLFIHHIASLAEHRLTAYIEHRAPTLLGGLLSEKANARSFDEVYFGGNSYVTPVMPALPKAGRGPAVVVLIPTLSDSSLFGGVATALVFGALLSKRSGRGLRIVQTVVNGGKPSKLQELFVKYGVSVDVDEIEVLSVAERRFNYYGYLDLHPDDQLVVSAWWDATIAAMLPLRRRFIYLVQDYEPIFYANGDYRLQAEHSYCTDRFLALCNTHLMRQCISEVGLLQPSTPVLSFEPAIARLSHGRRTSRTADQKRTLFFYGRPSVERNLYYFGLKVLNEAFSRGQLAADEWEVVMAGEAQAPNIQLEAGVIVRNLGKLTLDEYDELKLRTDVALSLMMAPHPSYPPLEFALAGAAVVTSKYGVKQDLSMYSPNILCTEPELEAMIAALGKAASMDHREKSHNAGKTILPSNWAASFGPIFDRVLDLVEYPTRTADSGERETSQFAAAQ